MKSRIVLLLCVMLGILLVGCGEVKEDHEVLEESTPSTSEVVSEVISEEVSEPVSEEVMSEEVVESVSEVPEIIDGVQKVYYENYEEFSEYIETLEETVVVVYSFEYADKGQAILYDGAHYSVEERLVVNVKPLGNVKGMYSTEESVRINNYDINGNSIWSIVFDAICVDKEVPIVINYEDGSEETITVYLTKEWES